MTFIRTAAAAAAAICIAGSAMAGGFATIVEEPIQIVTPTGNDGTLPGWVIPALIVAALIGVASAAEDDSATAGDDSGR